MISRQTQNELIQLIRLKFPLLPVKNEWAAFSGLINQYSPRVDIAIGPFNVEGPNLTKEYNRLVEDKHMVEFLQKAFQVHLTNADLALYNELINVGSNSVIYKNQNARCLIAFEIENKNSKKHIMRSIVNAASLGRIVIGIAIDEKMVRTFLRILNYLSFLKRVEKNTYDTSNFLVLSVEQLIQLLH